MRSYGGFNDEYLEEEERERQRQAYQQWIKRTYGVEDVPGGTWTDPLAFSFLGGRGRMSGGGGDPEAQFFAPVDFLPVAATAKTSVRGRHKPMICCQIRARRNLAS